MSAKEAAERVGIRYLTFLKQARRLKIGRAIGRRYEISERELQRYRRIADVRGLLNCEQVGKLMNLTAGQVGRYAKDIGIKPRPLMSRHGKYFFTERDIELMILARDQALEMERERLASEDFAKHRNRANRRRQHRIVAEDRENYDYYGRLTAFRPEVRDIELTEDPIPGGPTMRTLQWIPFYVPETLDPNDTATHLWANHQDWCWESFDELKERHGGKDWI